MNNKPIIYKFFKDFSNNRKRTKRRVDCLTDPSTTFFIVGTTDKNFINLQN